MSTYPHVSIIFPNYNGGKEPLECLSSIRKLNYPKNRLETIVIDNNSSDGSNLAIIKHFAEVKLIRMKHNLGFAKAINVGINRSKGEIIFVGNDDLVFGKDSLKIMVDYLIENRSIGVLGGKIYLKSNPKKVISSGYFMNRWTGNIYPAANSDTIKEADWVQGCAMLIPRKVFKKVGLFDPNFTHLFEDVDFCFRVKKTGYKVIYLPNAIFWHGESLTADKNKPDKYFQWYKGKIRFVLKHFSLVNVLIILLIQTIIISPYRAIFLKDKKFIPFLRGLYWNIANLSKTLNLRKRVMQNVK